MMGESHAILGAVATGTILIASGKTPANQGIIPFTLAVGLGAVIALLPDAVRRRLRTRCAARPAGQGCRHSYNFV